jgi:tetratricopeptide (TPR) repeat protein
MPDHCDKCGVAALQGETFATEKLPFCRRTRYCPACYARLYRRIDIGVALFWVAIGLRAIGAAWTGGHKVLDSYAGWWALLIAIQWLMVVPHELGHALAARLLGYQQIRILIGFGEPVFIFEFFGFEWMINRIPLGGLTLATLLSGTGLRWKQLAFVASGPAVNALVALFTWLAFPTMSFFDGAGTWPEIFFWANLLVLAENLIPYEVATAYGRLKNDGLVLWNTLFRWGQQPVSDRGIDELWALSKWALDATESARITESRTSGEFAQATQWTERALQRYPNDVWLLKTLAEGQYLEGKYADAEKTYDAAIASAPGLGSASYILLLSCKVWCIVGQADFNRADRVCMDYLNGPSAAEEKVRTADRWICRFLYQHPAKIPEPIENWARKILELAPGTLTLMGTLGGVLVERGKFAEAEPLLRECLERSPQLHDQGISALYLGIVEGHKGHLEEAKRLLKRAMTLHAEAWLLKKATSKLEELDGPGTDR